ncbi:hypothetical protein VQ056_20990 [Paenibacillus sp. JTLBN-2024]
MMRLQLYNEHGSALHIENMEPQGVRIIARIHTKAKYTKETNE